MSNFNFYDMKIKGKKNVYLNGKTVSSNAVTAYEKITKGLAKQMEEKKSK